MKRTLAALGLSFLALSALGQTPAAAPKPQLFLIHEEIARPSMVMQYESTTHDLLNALTAAKADPKTFGVSLFSTPDFHYIYVVPIANWGAIDSFQSEWMKLGDTIGKEKFKDLMNRGNATMSSYNEFVAVRRLDLSYMPATPRLKPEEQRYVQWQFYYLDAAHADDAEQIARDYAALFKAKNIADGFTVYQVLSGNDLPLLVVSTTGRSAADYAANDEKVNAMLGTDVRPLQARAMAITRKFEIRQGMYRPELSYPAMAMK